MSACCQSEEPIDTDIVNIFAPLAAIDSQYCSSDLALSAIFRDVSKTVFCLRNVQDLDFTFWVKKKKSI